jgi:hypothetical protein
VLLPEQASEANPQRCWNRFCGEAVTGAEAAVLHAIIEQARAHVRHRLSAGGRGGRRRSGQRITG